MSENNNREIKYTGLNKLFRSDAIQKLKDSTHDGTFKEFLADWKWIFSFSKKYRWIVILYSVIGILGSTISLGASYLSRIVINIVVGKEQEKLWLLVVIMVGMILLSLFLSSINSYISARISIYVNCHPCPDRGLPAGVRAGGTGDLLDAVRSVTRRLDEIEVSEAEVRAARATLLKELELRYARPETLMEDVLLRYSEGKDLITDYKGAVQRISAESVREILKTLSEGGEVEYTII